MQFQVPQFIEVKDKIFGPLTLQQFLYVAGGAGLCYLIFRYIHILLAIPLMIVVAALSLALAFYKLHGRAFPSILEAAAKWTVGQRLYIWKKMPKPALKRAVEEDDVSALFVPKLSESKLKDLTWSLDVKENLNPGAEESMKNK